MTKLHIKEFLESVKKAEWLNGFGETMVVYSWNPSEYWDKEKGETTDYGHVEILKHLDRYYHRVTPEKVSLATREYILMYRIIPARLGVIEVENVKS